MTRAGAQSSETLDLVAPAAPGVPDVSDTGGGAVGLIWGLLLALGVALLPRRGWRASGRTDC